MSDPVALLRAKKAKILEQAQQEAAALEADAAALENMRVLAEKHGFELVEKQNAHNTNGTSFETIEVSVGTAVFVDLEGPAYKAAINASENALRAAGAPLELSQLYDACVSLGVPLAGKRPQSTLSAFLAHQNSTVRPIRRGIYWLRGVPVPS